MSERMAQMNHSINSDEIAAMMTETPDDCQDTNDGNDGNADKRKRLFAKELRCMMYGFGDDQNPYTETVDMLEDLVIQFINDICTKAVDVGKNGKIAVEDVIYIVRRDKRKFARVRDLLTMNEELKKARKAFDEIKYVSNV